MSKTGADPELLEFAIAREIEANQFFLALAKRVDNPEIRKVFEDLAAEELEHKAKLELEVIKAGRTTATVNPNLIPEHEYIISKDNSLLDMDYKDVLQLGIEKEEASFRTYVSLLATVHDQESREVLLALAEEEVKHKLRFEIEYDLLLKQRKAD